MAGSEGYWVLVGHDAVYLGEGRAAQLEWSEMWDKPGSREVAQTTVGPCRVSTVFLGIDHSWFGGPPLLFETMIFGEPHEGACWRYSTWDEAEAGHKAIVYALENNPMELPERG